jgi:hypothetical protein
MQVEDLLVPGLILYFKTNHYEVSVLIIQKHLSAKGKTNTNLFKREIYIKGLNMHDSFKYFEYGI